MKSQVLASLLVLILVPTASPAALTQTGSPGQPATMTNAPDWQGLSNLKPGKRVLVEFKNGSTVDGKFVNAVGSRLTLTADGSTYILEQRDIRRVYGLKGKWSRDRAVGIGAGIGLVVGAFIGSVRMDRAEKEPGHVPSADDTGPLAAGASIGALAGAGALLGGKRRGKLLYESK